MNLVTSLNFEWTPWVYEVSASERNAAVGGGFPGQLLKSCPVFESPAEYQHGF